MKFIQITILVIAVALLHKGTVAQVKPFDIITPSTKVGSLGNIDTPTTNIGSGQLNQLDIRNRLANGGGFSVYKDPFTTAVKTHNDKIAAEKAAARLAEIERQKEEQAAKEQPVSSQSSAEVNIAPQVYNPGSVQSMIIHWAGVYGVSADWMLKIAKCESTYGKDWEYMGHYGLYQYLPSTWSSYSSQAGVGAPLNDLDAQAHVTAWALANGHAGAWSCA